MTCVRWRLAAKATGAQQKRRMLCVRVGRHRLYRTFIVFESKQQARTVFASHSLPRQPREGSFQSPKQVQAHPCSRLPRKRECPNSAKLSELAQRRDSRPRKYLLRLWAQVREITQRWCATHTD